MSFDLAVFYASCPLTVQEAARKYIALCERDPEDTSEVYRLIEPSDRVAAFIRELQALYPLLNEVPEEDLDNSPWSSEPDVSAGHAIMTMRWSCSNTVESTITAMALQHGLTVYNPQEDAVHLPPALRVAAPDTEKNP